MSNKRGLNYIDYSEDIDYKVYYGDDKTLVYKTGYRFYSCPECKEPLFVIVYLGANYATPEPTWVVYINDDDMRLHVLEHSLEDINE